MFLWNVEFVWVPYGDLPLSSKNKFQNTKTYAGIKQPAVSLNVVCLVGARSVSTSV